MNLKSFDSYLFSQLQDPEFSMLYLSEAYADSTEEFLVALGKYVQAKGGIDEAAGSGQISRDALTTLLSSNTSPEQRSLVLQSIALGLAMGEWSGVGSSANTSERGGRRTPALAGGRRKSAKTRRKIRQFS